MADEEKKKVIIVLWGPQDTGKTTTLRKLAQEFLSLIEEEGDTQIAFLYKGKRIVTSTAGDDRDTVEEGADLLKALEEGDIQIGFPYKGKRIVISTAGDDRDTVEEGADLLKALEADILVTATRARKKPKGQEAKCSIKALEDSEWDEEIRTKAVWIYKSYLTYDEREDTVLKESITKEQAKTIRNTINEEQAKTIKLVINNIIEEWEKKPEGNSASSDLVSE